MSLITVTLAILRCVQADFGEAWISIDLSTGEIEKDVRDWWSRMGENMIKKRGDSEWDLDDEVEDRDHEKRRCCP